MPAKRLSAAAFLEALQEALCAVGLNAQVKAKMRCVSCFQVNAASGPVIDRVVAQVNAGTPTHGWTVRASGIHVTGTVIVRAVPA